MFEFFRLWLLVSEWRVCNRRIVLVVIVSTPLFNGFHRLFDQPSGQASGRRDSQLPNLGVRRHVRRDGGLGPVHDDHRGQWIRLPAGLGLVDDRGQRGPVVPLDTGRSLIHRVYVNAIANTALLVILAIPLIGIFGEFH